MSEDPVSLESMRAANDELPIFKVLRVDVCARAILKYVSIWDLERLLSVCRSCQSIVQDYLPGYYSVTCCYDGVGRLKLNITHPKSARNVRILQSLVSDIKRVTITDRCPGHDVLRTIATELSNEIIDHVQFNELQVKDIVYFLKNLKSKKITFLNINFKTIYNIYNADYAYSAIYKSKFRLHEYPMKLLKNTHLFVQRVVLFELPTLEELNIRNYEDIILYNNEVNEIELSNELIESISCHSNLKRLSISNNACGNDDFLLEALAQRCRKLEYLDLSGCKMYCIGEGRFTARGLAALCRRSPSAVTKLDFSYRKLQCETMVDDFMCNMALCRELEDFCCIELMSQHIAARQVAMASQKRDVEVTLKLSSFCNAADAQDPDEELTIILGRVFYRHPLYKSKMYYYN